MTHFDSFDAPVSHRNQNNIDRFGKAAELMLGFAPDPVDAIKNVLKEAPDFIMARCFLAGAYLVASDKRRQPLLAKQYEILKTQVNDANAREKGHIKAISLWLKGDFFAASQAYGDILADCPRDLVALQYGHQTDFLLGQANMCRDRPARVGGHWSKEDPQYSYVLGMQAFGLEEAGHYAEGEVLAAQSVAMNPSDVWGTHALAHCLEMQGKAQEGIRFMERTEANWGHDNYMRIHNRWHLALYYLERCDFAKALALHDKYMTLSDDSELMDMHDSAAMLWRLMLFGVDVGDRWNPIANKYSEVIDQAYMAFTDIHGMMAFVSTGRDSEAKALISVLEKASELPTASGQIIRMVGLPMVRGFWAFGQGDYENAALLLAQAHPRSHLIGGSVAQRDIVSLTMLEAARRSGNTGLAKALWSERTLLKPQSPLTDMLAKNIH